MMRRAAIAWTTMLLLGGCVVGPKYRRPSAAVPAVYKESNPKGWQRAVAADAMDRGTWWQIYDDPVLDGLERKIDISNQNLKAAEAAYREAAAIVAEARAQFFPTLTGTAAATRSRSPGGGGGAAGGGSGFITNSFSLDATASWTPDVWGRIGRLVEANLASAQASAGDLASARLAAQGQLASDYLQLRMADALRRLLTQAVTAYAQSLRITRNQYRAGTTDQSSVSQAQAQLDSTRAQLIAVGNTRAALEHAIAVLIGEAPAALTIAPTAAAIAVPEIPADLPSALLERRPDIAASERRIVAANAEIGVAEAAFFPDLTLSAQSGTAASKLAHLFTAPSREWSFGGNLVETLFNGGLNHATVEQQRALYDAAVANYRQTVLTALQQVEDELAAQRILAEQETAARAAVAAAREAERVINNQYLAGTVAYTSVVVAEQTALADAEAAVNIRQARLVASVALIQALGGGWDTSQLPTPAAVERQAPLNFSPVPPPDAWPKWPQFLRFWEL